MIDTAKITKNVLKTSKSQKIMHFWKFCEQKVSLLRNFSYLCTINTETQTLIIATHGIVKKTGKTPPKEIAKAESIRKQYFELKKEQ